jgi:hypothetical protein
MIRLGHPIDLLSSLLVGLAATLGTIAIQGFVVHTVIMEMRRDLSRGPLGGRLLVNLTFVTGVTLFSLTGIALEIVIWAIVLDQCGAAAGFDAALFYSAGSFTTEGAGGLMLSPQWKLLGPIEAITGILMFGVSTALIFAIIQRLIHARFDRVGHK